MEPRKRKDKDRHHLSLVVYFLVFLSVSMLSLLVLDQETVRPMSHILARPEPETSTVLPGAERTPAGSEVADKEPQAAPPPLPPSVPVEKSCNDPRVLVDRSHPLPPGYTPEDLVSLQSYGVPVLGSDEVRLRGEAAERLWGLVSAAFADGEELIVASAYRSYEDQETLYGRLNSIYGSDAELMTAHPGYSQHQLGTAVDFTNAKANYQVAELFGYTTAAQWLSNHAHEYGFILAYPSGHETDTGYEWEPWHYRYVGVKNAELITDDGLSLQEFLAREGVVPHC
jgi:D-alanyl-D-alanine carboxypeptidase